MCDAIIHVISSELHFTEDFFLITGAKRKKLSHGPTPNQNIHSGFL
jgi:hypothetical protein